MNAWLDTLSSAARACNPAWHLGGTAARYFSTEAPRRGPYIGRAVFYWSDIVHTHAPIWRNAPAGTFCFTMLRDPAARLVSQFTDWQRLTDEDLAGYDTVVRDCIASTRTLTLAAFLERHGEGTPRFLVDNYMVRALAASRCGQHVIDVADMDELLGEALHVLHTDYDFTGIVEEYDASMDALCARLGVPPAGHTERLNAVCNAQFAPEHGIDPELLKKFTAYDRILYDTAKELFCISYKPLGQEYSLEAFERDNAARLLGGLRAAFKEGAAQHSVREPFYGSFLHQRDGGYDGNHAVWTRAGQRAAVFIPVPAGMRLEVLLWIRGYAEPGQRASLRVWLDGVERTPDFEPAEGYAELLKLPLLPQRNFARLELEVAPIQHPDPDDARPRGVSFDAYGWRPCF